MWKARGTAVKFDGTRQRRVIGANGNQPRSVRTWRKALFVTSALIGSLALPAAAHAQTWVGGTLVPNGTEVAGSQDYNNAANWSPGQVPGQNDAAFFGASNNTDLTLTAPFNTVQSWNFTTTTDYTFNIVHPVVVLPPAPPIPFTLAFQGAGIVGNSGHVTINNNTAIVAFESSSTAGNATINNQQVVEFFSQSTAGSATINNTQSTPANLGGLAQFFNDSTAGNATINSSNGELIFSDRSTAANATIFNNSSAGNRAVINFKNTSTAGQATIISNGPIGGVAFFDNSTADRATITNNGSNVGFAGSATAGQAIITNNAGPGFLAFNDTATAGQATITNNGGSTGFTQSATAGQATIVNVNHARIDFLNSSTAGNAVITNKDTSIISFANTSTAGSATISNAAALTFSDQSTGGNAAISNGAAATTDFSASSGPNGDHKLSAGSIAGGGLFALGQNQLTVGGNNLSTAVTGVIADGGANGGTGASLVKTGTGTLTLSGNNTYSGGTSINGGTVAISADSNLGAAGGNLAFNGGMLRFLADVTTNRAVTLNAGGGIVDTNGNNATLASTVSGAGGLTKTGTGTLTLGGNNTYGGGTAINGGTLAISADNNLGAAGGNLAFNGGTLRFLADVTSNRAVTLNAGGGIVDTNGNNATFASTVSGAGGLTKTGTGTLTLGGTNTYSGGTAINGGTLAISADNNLGDASGNLAFDGGTLRLLLGVTTNRAVTLNAGGGIVDTNGNNATFASTVSGAGGLTKTGTGRLTLEGNNTYTGSTSVNGGTLAGGVANAFSAVSAIAINGGGTLDLGGFAQTVNTINLAGGTLANGSLTGAVNSTGGTITGLGGLASLTTTGGTTTLDGSNTYSGATTISGGTLAGGIANAFSAVSTIAINGAGTLDLGGFAQTVNTINLAGGTLANGSLTGAVDSTGGTITGLGGLASLTTTNGTTTLDGSNAYTGATSVNGGTLAGGIANAFSAASAIAINSGGTLDLGGFAQTINTINLAGGTLENGSLTGAVNSTGGTITGLGGSASLTTTSGATALDGSNTYTGPTSVNGGTLLVNGSIASATTVNSGGTLAGVGSIFNDVAVNSGGMLAPGNATVGTSLTVGGNLALQSGAQYLVQLSPATSTFANVTGRATLGGATVNAAYTPGTFVSKQYTILNATSIGGTFATLVNTSLPNGFSTSLSYDRTHAFLNLTLNLVPPSSPTNGGGDALGNNQRNVANALINFFNTAGGIPGVFGTLTPAGLSQLSGEGATSSQQAAFNAVNQFMGVLTDPFVEGRGDVVAPSGGATGYAGEGDALAYAAKRGNKSERDAYATMARNAPAADTFAGRWSVWAAAYGGSQATDGNATLGSNSTTSRIFGTAVGADYRISPYTLAGFALAGGGTNFSVVNGGSGRSDLFQAGAFIRHNVGAAYFSGALAYGWQDITTNRTVTVAGIDQLRAEFNANAWSGRVEGGYRFVSPWMGGIGITPYAAGQFTTFDLPAYAEQAVVGTNIFALAYASKSVTDTRSELGLRTDKSYAMLDGILTLRGRVAWAHDYDPNRSIGATFQTLPGASFVVGGAAQASDSALVTAAAEKKWLNGWSAAATFEGEFSQVTASYAGKGAVRYAW
jgi:autotransporter-associated beta strand protein